MPFRYLIVGTSDVKISRPAGPGEHSSAIFFASDTRRASRRSQIRLEKYRRYALLLDGGDAGSAEEVQQLAEELRIDNAQLLADMKTIQRAHDLERLLHQAKADQVSQKCRDARKALAEYKAETERIMKDRAEQTAALDDADLQATAALRRIGGNQDTLAKMVAENPYLLGCAMHRDARYE